MHECTIDKHQTDYHARNTRNICLAIHIHFWRMLLGSQGNLVRRQSQRDTCRPARMNLTHVIQLTRVQGAFCNILQHLPANHNPELYHQQTITHAWITNVRRTLYCVKWALLSCCELQNMLLACKRYCEQCHAVTITVLLHRLLCYQCCNYL